MSSTQGHAPPPHRDLDQRLTALFGGLDASPGFDARVMACLRTETQADAIERAARARQEEQHRYSKALAEALRGRRRSFGMLVLDTLGVAGLATAAGAMIWQYAGAYLSSAVDEWASGPLPVTGFAAAAALLIVGTCAFAAWRFQDADLGASPR